MKSHHQPFSTVQVQALMAKYRLDNNIDALVQLGINYAQFQKPIRDILGGYAKRADKVNNRLREVGLANHIVGG